MYRPERSEKVVALFVPKDKNEDPYYSVGIWTGKTDDTGEHYLIEFAYPPGEKDLIHYEDLLEDTEENRERIPESVSIFF